MVFWNFDRPRRTRRQSRHNSPAQIERLENRTLLSGVASPDAVADQTEQPQTPSAFIEFSSIEGSGNNLSQPELGSASQPLLRLVESDYGDGISSPAGADRPGAREISNAVAAADSSITNDRYLTDYVWIWGQFIDHDIDLTENAVDDNGNPLEPLPIEVPLGDPLFDPASTGNETIDFNRSISTIDDAGVRQQINQITSFLDGSVIYGSDSERASELRTFEDGQLKVSDGDLLPFNEAGLENAGGTSADLFLAGDVRANENVALSSMHTIWVREHNRVAAELLAENSELTDEEIYQQARAIVTGELQAITYNEFLPALLGYGSLGEYTGYDSTVDPSISNIFSTAAYRFGHSLLSPELLRLDESGNLSAEGSLPLRSAFFSPEQLIDHDVDSILRGASAQLAQELDNQIVDDVRNFLFGPPGAGGFDLASLNIQRGRDHGLPDYNQARRDLGLVPVSSFTDITSDPQLAATLQDLYGDVDSIDVWVGGLAEDHLPGSSLGELFSAVVVDQFERLRAGDRFWYENVFSGEQLREIDSTTLADVIERNSGISGLQDNVFFSPSVQFVRLADHGAKNVTIRTRGDSVELVDNRSQQVISRRAVTEVVQVIVVGSDTVRERITVDPLDPAVLPGGLVISAGTNRGDAITFRSTRGNDLITVAATEVSMNGLVTQYSGVDKLTIEARKAEDTVEIDDDVETAVVVSDADSKRSRRLREQGVSTNDRDELARMDRLRHWHGRRRRT